MTFGVVRPVVLLPPQARDWSDEMRRAVLLHELAHVQRADVLFQLLGRAACTLYWFHPLVWLALKNLRREREQACDDAVLHTGEPVTSYAEQLLEVARLYCRPHGMTLAVEMARMSQLEQRLRSMFDAARSHAPLNRLWGWGLAGAILFCATGIAVVELVSQEPASEIVETRDDRGRLVAEAGPLSHVMKVVDSQQNPVVGAKLIQLGYGTARGSGCSWGKDWPTDFVTDEQGKVEIHVPEVSDVAARGEKGIVGLYFSVDHPQHPIKRVGLRRLDSQDVVELDDCLRLSIRAVRDGNPAPIVTDLFLKASGWSAEQPKLQGEEWIAGRLNPNDIEGGRLIRIVHAAEGQPVWYSELIDLQKQFPDAGSEQMSITLFPGVQVDGVLDGNVPRPVQGGRVCAYIADGVPAQWHWHDVAEIAADGSFSFPSLPRDTNLQLTAICDGWVSQSPTNEENQVYATEFGLQIREKQAADSMVWSRLFRLRQQTTRVQLPMTPTYECEVTLVSEGRPLADVEVSFWPNQLMTDIGSTLLGTGFSDLNRFQSGDKAEDIYNFNSDWWKANAARYQALTDANGRALVRYLPLGDQDFSIQSKDYEIEPDWFEEIFGNLDDWRPDTAHTQIEAEQANRVTVQLQRKAETKVAAKALAEDDQLPVTAIQVVGNSHIAKSEILRPLKLKVGQTLSQDDVMQIVTTLVKTGWFALVEPAFAEGKEGLELVIRVVERPVIPVRIVLAENALLWEGKEIVTWDEVEQRLAAYPNPAQLQPALITTQAGYTEEKQKIAQEKMAKFKQRFQYYGDSIGSLWVQAWPRYDRIRTPDDLKPNEADRISGRVVDQDGKPVEDVEVMLILPLPKDSHLDSHTIYLKHGRLRNDLEEVVAQSAADGRFQLYPPPDQDYTLIAMSPKAGFGYARKTTDNKEHEIKLYDWSGLECTLEGNPKGHTLSLSSRLQQGKGLPDIYFHTYAEDHQQTVDQQPFRFDHVPFYSTSISRGIRYEEGMTFNVPEATVDLLPGEVRRITFGPITPQQLMRSDETRRMNEERGR